MGNSGKTILESALAYLSHGLSVIPTRKDKKPSLSWKPYQDAPPAIETVREWWTKYPAAGIGIITGRVSGGLWVLDCDSDAALEWFKHNAPDTPRMCKTRRGMHAYYRTPPGAVIRNSSSVVAPGVDVRGEGGYVIAPPSPHADGCYEWLQAGPWGDIPLWEPPITNIPLLEQKHLNDGTHAAEPTGGNLNLDLAGVRPLSNLNPVDDGERNAKLASVVGKFITEGYSLESIRLWLDGWNLQNNPPLESKVLDTTLKSIVQTHIRNHGSLPMQPVTVEELPAPAPPIDDDIPESLLHPGGLIEMVMDYIGQNPAPSFPLFSMAAAMCLIGTLAGQKVMTETGLRTNLYIFALAPSGTGKNAPISAIKKLMFEADCGEL